MEDKKLIIEEIIKRLESKIFDLFKYEGTGHDISHLLRVTNLALKIQEKENQGTDPIVVGVAAFLHDLHRIMQKQQGVTIHPKESLPLVRELLEEFSLNEHQLDEICYCIEHHENYNWNGNNVDNINALIVQDADNLDMIGAIGIGRTFTYGGANGMLMYDPKVPINSNNDYTEFIGNDPSTIHHFYHKLFKLKDNMNTKTAKELAQSRSDFLEAFVEEFLDEWNGIK